MAGLSQGIPGVPDTSLLLHRSSCRGRSARLCSAAGSPCSSLTRPRSCIPASWMPSGPSWLKMTARARWISRDPSSSSSGDFWSPKGMGRNQVDSIYPQRCVIQGAEAAGEGTDTLFSHGDFIHVQFYLWMQGHLQEELRSSWVGTCEPVSRLGGKEAESVSMLVVPSVRFPCLCRTCLCAQCLWNSPHFSSTGVEGAE